MKIERYEYKYLVTEAQARRVREAVAPFVRPDPHAAHRPDFVYPIASLYLDSRDLRLYHETLEGRRARFKLRVRAYSDDPGAPRFAEIKRRLGGVVHKVRAQVEREQCGLLLDGRPPASGRNGPDPAWEEFSGLLLRIGALPRVIVRYDREAYVSSVDPAIRVTFDRRLRAAPARGSQIEVERPDFRVVAVPLVVLEFKFNRRIPFWLPPLVGRLELRRRSFSKYAHAVQAAIAAQSTFSA